MNSFRGKQFLGIAILGLVTLAGCNGDDSTGDSFADRYQQAVNEKDPLRSAQLLIALADDQRKAKDFRSAKQTLNSAGSASRDVSEPRSQANLSRRVARVQARVDDSAAAAISIKSAYAAANKIEQPEFRANTICDIAETEGYWMKKPSEAKASIQEAEKLAATVEDSAGQVTALARAGWAYGRCKFEEDSARAFGAAVALSESISDPSGRCRALLEVAKQQSRLKDNSATQATLALATTAANSIDAESSQAQKLADVAVLFAKIDQRAEALKLLEQADSVARKDKDIHFSEKAIQYVAKIKQGI